LTEVERKILATIAFDETNRIHAFDIEPEYFESPDAREMFKVILENIETDLYGMYNVLNRRFSVETKMMDDIESQTFFEAYKRSLKESANERIVKNKLNQILQSAVFEPEKVANELLKSANKLQFNTEGEFRSTGDVADSLIEQLQMIWDNKKDTIKLPYLDRLCSDLFGGELIAIAGRPGMGKTALMLNMARQYSVKKIPVGFLSLEMKGEQLELRLAQKDWAKSLKYEIKFLNANERDLLTKQIKALEELPIYFNDKISARLGAMLSSIYMMVKTKGCKIVFIDYLQLMPTNRRGSRNDEIAEISRRLKMLATELDIVIIAGSQLSRGVEHRDSKRPTLADLRDSGAIEQDCDMVVFCFREGYYKSTVNPEKLELIVAKQRDGVTGTEEVRFIRERQLIVNDKR